MMREANDHRSPNSGWPEPAVTGAFGLTVAGPRQYAEYKLEDPITNPTGRKEATAQDINGAFKLMARFCGIMAGALLVLAAL